MVQQGPSVDGILSAWYHSFWLGDEEWDVDPEGPCEAGMITQTASRSGVLIDTATHSGYLQVTLRFDTAEPTGSAEEFEDIAKGTIQLSDAQIVAQPTGADGDPITLALPAAGLYGFQVASRGRGAPDAVEPANVKELYVIDVWPIERPVPPEVVKITSARGLERLSWP